MQVRFAREGEPLPAHVHIVVDLVWLAVEGGRGEGWSREVAKALVRQRGDSGKGHRGRADDQGRVLPWMNKGGVEGVVCVHDACWIDERERQDVAKKDQICF